MPTKPTPFSERVAAARARRQAPRIAPSPQIDPRSDNDRIIDDYFSGGDQEDTGWKDTVLKTVEKYNPLSLSGLREDVSDLGHKITHPIETLAPGGPFARGLGGLIKKGEELTGHRPSGYGVEKPKNLGEEFNQGYLGEAAAAGVRDVKKVVKGLRSSVVNPLKEALPDLTDIAAMRPGNFEDAARVKAAIEGFGQGEKELVQGMAQDPLSVVDPGFREATRKSRGGTVAQKLGRLAVPAAMVLGPTKAGTLLGDVGKGVIRSPLTMSEAWATGAARRAAAEEATQISRQAQVGRTSAMMPVHPSRQIPGFGQTSNVGTMFRGSEAGMIPPDPTRVGPIEFHTPQPVSAGMGGTTAAQMPSSTRAFEALVPNRYKADVTATGLNVPKLGDVTGPPTPGLPVVTERGVLRGSAAQAARTRGTTGLPEMVQQYGLEEAARRARMTVEEVQGMLQGQAQPSVEELATQGLASLKRDQARAPQPKAQIPFQITKSTRQQLYDLGHTKAQVNAMSPEAAQQAVGAGRVTPATPQAKKAVGTRMFGNATDQTLETLAGRGNQEAVREIGLRRGGLSRLTSETGAVGRSVPYRRVGGRSPAEAFQRLMENQEGKIEFTTAKLEDFLESWKRILAAPRNSIRASWGGEEARYAGTGPPGLQKGDPSDYGTKVVYRDTTGKPVIQAKLGRNWDGHLGISIMGADPEAPMGMMARAMNAVTKHLVDDLGVRGAKGTVSPYTRNYITKMITNATGKTEAELNELIKTTAGHGPVKPGGQVFETEQQKKWFDHMTTTQGYPPSEIERLATEARSHGVHFEYTDDMDYLQEAIGRGRSGEYYPTGEKIQGAEAGKLNRMLAGQERFPRNVQDYANRKGVDLDQFRQDFQTKPSQGRLAYRKFIKEMEAGPPQAVAQGPFTTPEHMNWADDMEDFHDPSDIRETAQRAVRAGVDFTQYTDLGDLEDAISQARSAARSSFAQGQSSSFGSATPPPSGPARSGTWIPDPNNPGEWIWGNPSTPSPSNVGGRLVGGRVSRILDETGSVGPGTEDIMRRNIGRGGRIGNERGAVSLPSKAQLKNFGKGAVNTANEVRLASMLSGWAVPKSLLGNVGAHGIAAIEDLAAGKGMKSLDPIKEGLRLPTNFKNAWKYYKQGNSPQITQMMGPSGKASWINQPARIMGAFDEASTQSLMRSGKTLEEAQRLLLQDPQYGLKGPGSLMMNYLVPFRRTPFNVLQGGGRTIADHPLLSAGAMGLGAGGGMASDDPRAIGLMAALFGPYTLPFLMGAGTTAGLRSLQGLSPIPEWSISKSIGDPLSPFAEPAALRMFEEPGQAPQTSREKMLNKRGKRGTRKIPKRNR